MKIDNIFKRTVSDKVFSEKYEVPYGDSKTIADGMNSSYKQVRALASMLKQIDKTVEDKRTEQRLRNQDTTVVLTDAELSSLYKKVLKDLQTTF